MFNSLKLKYTVRNSKKTKLNKQKNTWSAVTCTCIHVWFSPRCCHRQLKYFRHLGPNLYIFAVKVSPWFHRHFTEILWHTFVSPPFHCEKTPTKVISC